MKILVCLCLLASLACCAVACGPTGSSASSSKCHCKTCVCDDCAKCPKGCDPGCDCKKK